MNGINQISVISENVSDLQYKLTDLTYDDLTNTTTIVNNTQLYDVVINGSFNVSNIQIGNTLTLSYGGVMTFIDDGLSGNVVDTIHNQTIYGHKVFQSAEVDTLTIDNMNAISITTQTVFGNTIYSDNITNSQIITTDTLVATSEIYTGNINISDTIIADNITGSAPGSFVYNATTVCHKDAIINAPSQTVIPGDLVLPNSIGLSPFGDDGLAIDVLDPTNRSITFSPPGNFNLTTPAPIASLSCGFALGNTIVSYESLAPYLSKGFRGLGTSANQPFIETVSGLYTAFTPTFSLSMANLLIKSGYIDLTNHIVSLDPFPIGNYVNMAGLNNPTFISGNVLTNQYDITSRNPITPTTEVTFSAVPLNSTTLVSIVNWGGSNNFSFVTEKFGIQPGCRVTSNSAFFNLTLSIAHTPPTITTSDLSGYVFGGNLIIESNPILPLNRRVVGLGTGVNGVPANTNSYIETTPGTPSSKYIVRNGSSLLTPTNTATSTATGFIKSVFGSSWLVSTAPQTNNIFVEQSGIPQATRLKDPTGFFAGQSKIMQLHQLNGYTISATSTPAFTAIGMVSSTTEIKLTTNPAVTTQMIENTTTPNQFVVNGTQVSSYNGTNQLITSSGLTAQTATSTTIKGYMRTTTLFEGRGLGNSTPRLNWFISGTNIGANKNYVSVASSASPFTLGASTNTATTPTGLALAGFTKYRDANSFFLVLANSTPFKFADYLIHSPTGSLPESTGLSDGLNDPVSSNDIIVIADYSTYTSSSVTVREPPIISQGYKAYPVSVNTYYVLETITLGATGYINSTKLDGVSPGFARDLALRGTFASNLYTTSSTLGSTTVTTGFLGAIFNGGASGYYFCSNNSTNLIQNFIVATTIAPAGSVIWNSDLFDKGSLTCSKLEWRVAPVASTPVAGTSISTSWYIRSNSVDVGGGFFDTELYMRTGTRITSFGPHFFINSVTATTFNNSGLNGSRITAYAQEATLNCIKATFRGKTNMTATTQKGGDLGIFQQSALVYRIDTLGLYAPSISDFIRIANRTNVNNIRAVTSLGSNLYDITLEYTEGALGSGFSYVITAPVSNTASLLPSTSVTGHLSEYLVAYTPGSTYSYYPSNVNYSIFSPINMSFYAPVTYNTFTPQLYSVQTPFLYSFVQPISISDFNKTTISFYNTETIQFYEYYNVTLPPSACELVGDVCTQTLTNKTFDRIGLQTITTQTSTQLGYTIRNTLTATTMATANTWLEPPGNTGRITLASQGVYLLSYAFSTRTITVLMGCLSESATAPYATPSTTDGTGVLCFSGSVNTNTNWITCSNTIVYVNTTANRIIYLWWASNGVALIKTNGNYFQAVRIA
jgi:hypothetical protein